MAINISLAAEPVLHIGGLSITNSVLAAWLISGVLLILGILLRVKLTQVPSKAQSFFEMIYTGLLETTEKVIGRADVARDLFPFIITAFVFIVISNWFGLIPGISSIGVNEVIDGAPALIPLLRAPTTDLNMVIALALISVTYVQFLGIKYLGGKNYAHKFFNFSSPIYFFVGILELISEFTRIISYSFRLFGNIFAGEVLIAVMFYLTTTLLSVVPVLPLPFFVLEMFVGLIQAFVFCFLTIVFAALAIAAHGDDSHDAKVILNEQVTV
jgi:F-type H+-transporting ATPase subunit a